MKILLADDHELVRHALALLLKRQGSASVDEAASAYEVERLLGADPKPGYDIILLDYDMPGMNGLEGLGRIVPLAGDSPVALLSGIAPPEIARAALQAGARGFLPKTLNAEELAAALTALRSGGNFLPQGIEGESEGVPLPDLTTREAEVLRGLCGGKSNKEIARDLNLQEVTIKLHVRTLCRKLDARNRTHAAMIARDRRILG